MYFEKGVCVCVCVMKIVDLSTKNSMTLERSPFFKTF